MLKTSSAKLLAVYLVFATVLISLPAPAWAMFMPSSRTDASRQADRAIIQKYLETTVVKQRLLDYGLSTKEASARLNSLSDEQIHQFASRLDAVQAGGDDGGLLIFLLLVAIIVVVVLQATGRRVIIR